MKHGVQVFLIDEISYCHLCTHQNCKDAMNGKGFEYRVWNRDMAACLNFIQIILSLRNGNGVPTQLHQSVITPKRSRNEGQQQTT
ncbi:hypothetical protein BDF22DRAFT_776127 [Syncephalis plumigaleata]|nr:hypothetical protein BDF22DRAFT_776127 [Syncephalis plumigaleata]